MFDPTTDELWMEIQEALKETAEYTGTRQDLLRRYTGPWYRKDQEGDEIDPENFAYGFVSNVLPQLGVNEPKCKVVADRVIGHKVISQAMEDGLDAWSRDTRYLAITEPCRLDFLFTRGVLLHTLAPEKRFNRGTVTPKVERLNPDRHFIDALADSAETAEFMGHWFWMDIDDILNDENANPEVVEHLSPDGGGALDSDSSYGRSAESGSELGRRRVRCYSVWIRESNTIRVLVESSRVQELYEPTAYFGPKEGPYVLADAYEVPGHPHPLSPIIAVFGQSMDLNVHARAIGRAADRRKSIGLVEAAAGDLGARINDSQDGDVIPVKGLTGQYIQVELGGVTDMQYRHHEFARNRLDRVSGLTATVQGNVGGADTATEAAIAQDALTSRLGYLKKKIQEFHEESLRRIGWYLFHTEGIVIPVNRRDFYTGEQIEGLFFGGPMPTDMGATWDDFNLKIKMNTLQRSANSRENLLGFYGVFLQICQASLTFPQVRWMNVIRDLADAYEVPDKADEWMVPEIFGSFGQPPLAPVSGLLGGGGLPGQPQAGGGNQANPALMGGGAFEPPQGTFGTPPPGVQTDPGAGAQPLTSQTNISRRGQQSGPRRVQGLAEA